MTTVEILKAIESGAWVIDLRPKGLYAAGHLPGSLSFGIDGSFATYFGWLYPYGEKLMLLSDRKDDITYAQRELVRIGIDRPDGAMVGDLAMNGELATNKTVTFDDVPAALEDPKILVLDVRRNSERHASHIEGTAHIPLHELKSRLAELPKDKEIWVHCAGAYRAAGSLGILESAGLKPVLINEPYDACLKVSGLSIIKGMADAGPVAPSDVKVSA
jgi:rhodanese-related sulfurtransferase